MGITAWLSVSQICLHPGQANHTCKCLLIQDKVSRGFVVEVVDASALIFLILDIWHMDKNFRLKDNNGDT